MLLRRVTKHVRNQNWFAVFVDFFIVVVGVFIGIQVANWNESIKAKQDEKAYLERIHGDIEFAEKFSKRTISRRINTLNSSLDMVELMNTDGNEFTDNYVSCYFPSTVSIQINLPTLNTINELLATGNLNLLSSEPIRSAILQLHTRIELLRRFQDFSKTEMIDIPDVFSNSIKLRSRIDDNDEVRLERLCNLKALHANNRFINAINDGIDITDAFINSHVVPWSKQLGQLHQLIDEDLRINHKD